MIDLVQSGKMTNIGDARPKRNDAAAFDDGVDTAVSVIQTIARISTTVNNAPIASLSSLFQTFVSVIVPSLIAERPKALLDYCALMQSVIAITETPNGGWTKANRFMTATLARQVAARRTVGAHDPSMIIGILATYAPAHAAASSSAPSAARIAAPQQQRPTAPKVCKMFNFSAAGCVTPNCQRVHECIYKPKCTNTTAHAGKACTLYQARTEADKTARGTRRGRNGSAPAAPRN